MIKHLCKITVVLVILKMIYQFSIEGQSSLIGKFISRFNPMQSISSALIFLLVIIALVIYGAFKLKLYKGK